MVIVHNESPRTTGAPDYGTDGDGDTMSDPKDSLLLGLMFAAICLFLFINCIALIFAPVAYERAIKSILRSFRARNESGGSE